jgi:6-phosphofructokinase 1
MGRTAGHLALGIGKAAGATLTIIPEEFPGPTVPLTKIVDTLVGGILKRRSLGRRHGVAVIAEGLVLSIAPEDFARIGPVERDAHGHVRLAEVNFGEILKVEARRRLELLGVETTIAERTSAGCCADRFRSMCDLPWLLRREVLLSGAARR